MVYENWTCEKTGCTAQIGNRRAHGDLFRCGDGYLMRVNQWSEDTGFANWMYHAEFDTWFQWFDENSDHINTVLLPPPIAFSYTGIARFT